MLIDFEVLGPEHTPGKNEAAPWAPLRRAERSMENEGTRIDLHDGEDSRWLSPSYLLLCFFRTFIVSFRIPLLLLFC